MTIARLIDRSRLISCDLDVTCHGRVFHRLAAEQWSQFFASHQVSLRKIHFGCGKGKVESTLYPAVIVVECFNTSSHLRCTTLETEFIWKTEDSFCGVCAREREGRLYCKSLETMEN